MKAMPHIVSVMTPFPHTIEVSRTLAEAKAVMYGGEFRHLPVIENGLLVGILSDRDVKLALAVTKAEEAEKQLLVGDACNFEAYIVETNERLDKVVAHMAQNRIGSALVAKAGKLVGIFTTTDACRLYAELLKIHYPDA